MASTFATICALTALFPVITTSIPLIPRFVSENEILSAYDYVVIGGGTSGLTVANRLSEDSSKTVLVIESGPMDDGSESFKIPYLGRSYLNYGTKYDWNITSVPAESLGNKSIIMPHARVLGGTSSINGMQFSKGAASDYNSWEELGNEGWNFESLGKYFKKSENFTAPSEKLAEEFGITYDRSAHGFTGFIHSSFPRFLWPLLKNWIGALKSLGHSVSQDPANGGALQLFWSPYSLDPDTQTRSFSREYYDGAQDRPNLHILLETTVTKLTFGDERVRVNAVEFSGSAGAPKRHVKVKREAVLAAGSIFSPQILQVSGIGPAGLLESLGIRVIVDLPGVGANLQGHVYVLTLYQMTNVSLAATNLTTNTTFYNEMYDLYKTKRDGPFTNAGASVVAMLPFSDITSDNLQGFFETPSEPLSYRDTSVSKGYQAQLKILLRHLTTPKMAATELIWLNEGAVIFSVMHPLSRGTVTTTSSSLLAGIPAVNTGHLTHPLDTRILVESLRYTRKIIATDEMQELGLVEVAPGAGVNSDEQIEKAVRDGSGYMYHMAGTCAMMKRELGGVVDKELRVYGVQNLRVVDASVQPLIPAAHLQATVYAVAEKAADLIKAGSLWRA